MMRGLILALSVLLLGGCMKPSDLAEGALVQLRDVGLLEHSQTQRAKNYRLQADSFVYIAQGHFVPPGHAYPRPNVVAEEAFNGFVQYFPRVRRATGPLGLDQAMDEARAAGADYLLYGRFAAADDAIGTGHELDDQRGIEGLGLDRSVIQLMVLETATGYLFDAARISSRGGFLTFYDNRPEDLIGPPLRGYARRLIGLN